MKKLLKVLCLLSIISLYGCFDITEEITIQRNGSGEAKFMVTAEWLSALLKESAKKDSLSSNGKSGLTDKSSSLEKKLKIITGIEGTYASFDIENSSIGIGFNFKSINALNKALNELNTDSTALPHEKNKVYYKGSGKKFSRTDEYYKKADNKKEVSENSYFKQLTNSMMESARYKIVINLPDNARKVKVSNSEALIGNNGKTVILEHKLVDLAQNKASLALDIKYR